MRARVPFALRNLTHRKLRSATALAAVCFSALLMFMELGFYQSVMTAAITIYRAMDVDLFVVSTAYQSLGHTATIPRQRIYQARAISGVRQVLPLFVDIEVWRNPRTRLRYGLLILGMDPSMPFQPFTNAAPLLRGRGLLLDTLSRPWFGSQDVGVTTEIGQTQVRVAGNYTLGPGFTADGAAVVSSDTFLQIFPHHDIGNVSVGLIRLDPNSRPEEVAESLRRSLPSDTRVFTRAELLEHEKTYWADGTSLGPVFGSGVVLGLIIGIVILYQVMSNDIASRIREYATLKALGYTFRQLAGIVLTEVSAFGVAGFVLGLLLASTLYKFVREETGMPVAMDASMAVAVFLLTLAMCWISGWLATRRVRRADPAELF